ncbi:hypothetical protein BDA96_06G175300 [Sorghum bicolor]|uniref:Uncharacterized protein n=1 Tax=Sorghum bicolor TaxID=4558 RepID=A0A921QUE9_SORBI|nr:hypothetical protein BDA96_06G175300 [Sorghum bicolor]
MPRPTSVLRGAFGTGNCAVLGGSGASRPGTSTCATAAWTTGPPPSTSGPGRLAYLLLLLYHYQSSIKLGF